jgi:peptidyl-prolyl cis-trans isomerase A (cyclophilin A)
MTHPNWGLGAILSATVALLSAPAVRQPDSALLLQPDHPEMNRRAPDVAHVRLDTTKGVIRMEMRRAWAPRGVDRFYNLVRRGYYDDIVTAAIEPVRAARQ